MQRLKVGLGLELQGPRCLLGLCTLRAHDTRPAVVRRKAHRDTGAAGMVKTLSPPDGGFPLRTLDLLVFPINPEIGHRVRPGHFGLPGGIGARRAA